MSDIGLGDEGEGTAEGVIKMPARPSFLARTSLLQGQKSTTLSEVW